MIPLAALMQEQPQPLLEIDLVQLMAGWAAGFNAYRQRQRHVLAMPINGAVAEVFAQDVYQN